ncbi:MAG: hypothetical protein ACFBSC_21445 [Microcoleaceae cyanobacterium]
MSSSEDKQPNRQDRIELGEEVQKSPDDKGVELGEEAEPTHPVDQPGDVIKFGIRQRDRQAEADMLWSSPSEMDEDKIERPSLGGDQLDSVEKLAKIHRNRQAEASMYWATESDSEE